MLPAAICGLVWIGEVPRESGFIWLLWREAACYATRKVIWVQLGGTHTHPFFNSNSNFLRARRRQSVCNRLIKMQIVHKKKKKINGNRK